MELKKKIKITLIIISLLITGFLLFQYKKLSADIYKKINIIENESFFDTYTVINDTVYLYCQICIENSSNEEKDFRIIGDFYEDVGRLLTDGKLVAYDNNKETTIFSIKKKCRNYYSIVFIGRFAGIEEKENRYLPPIRIEVLEE